MAKNNTSFKLIFKGLIKDNKPTTVNKTNGIKAGNSANDSIKFPRTKLNADR
jgi:hypothetical protein